MGRKPVPQPLTLPDAHSASAEDRQLPSGETLRVVPPSSASFSSPRTPKSPFSRFSPKKSQSISTHRSPSPLTTEPYSQPKPRSLEDYDDDDDDDDDEAAQQYPHITSALYQPSETPTRPHHQHKPSEPHQNQQRQHQPDAAAHHREPSRPSKSGSFFNFKGNSKSGHQYSSSRGDLMSKSPDTSTNVSTNKTSNKLAKKSDKSQANPGDSLPSKSDLSLASASALQEHSSAHQPSSKKSKSKTFSRLNRTKSGRDRDNPNPLEYHNTAIPMPTRIAEPEKAHSLMNHNTELRTAPLGAERTFRDMVSSAARNRSEDRAPSRDKEGKDRAVTTSSLRENTGFFHGLRSSSTKAADMISKGLFGKSMRSASSTEREPVVDDENYVLKVINLPLVEQTRLTRISKRLEDSRDKTEFWLPAFPWRAIDYLNYKGCDVEGLYRVPGSGPQIKKWQRRFDEEYDVDLFEQDDLYDINIVGSMLKAWLRELPDELFPKEAQNRVARECAGAEKVPELLIEELSNLPPFNYYLLFAITCHLSLLLAHSDKNKMDFRNLCICFQPCMKIDVFCFKFLVCDWRDCWRGCKYEAKYIEEEYKYFDLPPPQTVHGSRALLREQPSAQDSLARQTSQGHSDAEESNEDTEERQQQPVLVVPDERAVSSGSSSPSNSSSKQAEENHEHPKAPNSRFRKKPPQLQDANGIGGSNSTADSTTSATSAVNNGQLETPKRTTELRPLSPIKPLSPLGF